jgi:cysteine desulfurase / selenocysteine lyase
VTSDTAVADFMAFSDHKFLLNAGRGMGYLYIRRNRQAQLVPFGAGWRAGAEPFSSFFGPGMALSDTASWFDASISWLAAIGNKACLQLINEVGPERIYARNLELSDYLRSQLTARGLSPLDLGAGQRSHIIALPLTQTRPEDVLARLKARGVAASARGGYLRLAINFYNDEADVDRAVEAIAS